MGLPSNWYSMQQCIVRDMFLFLFLFCLEGTNFSSVEPRSATTIVVGSGTSRKWLAKSDLDDGSLPSNSSCFVLPLLLGYLT